MKKNNFKIISIDGLGGLFLLISFVSIILVSLLIGPLWAIKEIWNSIIVDFFALPSIDYNLAFLLWLAGLLSIIAIMRNFISIKFNDVSDLEGADIDSFLDKISQEENLSEEEKEEFENILKSKDNS